MEIYLEPNNNEVRCKNSLELLGHYFQVDGVKYFIKEKPNSCNHTWIHNIHQNTKYCSKGCDGFKKHNVKFIKK